MTETDSTSTMNSTDYHPFDAVNAVPAFILWGLLWLVTAIYLLAFNDEPWTFVLIAALQLPLIYLIYIAKHNNE